MSLRSIRNKNKLKQANQIRRWKQEFTTLEAKKMKRKFTIVFTIIVLLTAVIPVLAYKQNIDYQRHVQEIREEYAKIGIDPDVSPWYAWGMGPLVAFLVAVTIDAWIVSSIIWFQERRQKNRKEMK